MNRLEQLPEVTRRGLAGLEAGPGLKYRIEQQAAQPQKRTAYGLMRTATAFAAVCVLVGAAVIGIRNNTVEDNAVPRMVVQQAGPETKTILAADPGLTGGDVTFRSVGSSGLWENGAAGTYPIIGIRGHYYRMLSTPAAVPGSLLGGTAGTVEEVTGEPALSSPSVVMSNVTALGATVRQVNGMGGMLVAAEVNGSMRLFQRVSFNGMALSGGEKLSDTLQISGHVVSIALSGHDPITDPARINTMVQTLLNTSSYESAGQVTADAWLVIGLDNGLSVQLAVRGSRFSACGTWSCPDFFEQF